MTQSAEPISYRSIIALAWPASIAALITPLLGLSDAIVLGYSPRPYDIGATGMAAALFSLAYWTFGFLRMSTAGLTAQASGQDQEPKIRRILAQALGLGGLIGLIFVIGQIPYGAMAFRIVSAGANVSAETLEAAQEYYAIRIWGAPFVLMSFAAFGWFTGRGHTKILMLIVSSMTMLNIGLDVWLVLFQQMGTAGVAIGTLISEITGAGLCFGAIIYLLHRHGGIKAYWSQIDYFAPRSLIRLMSINFDIFMRTLVLVGAFTWFIQQSAVYGDTILSANQILLQLFLITGLALDGVAIAGETFIGQALGYHQYHMRYQQFWAVIKKASVIAISAASLLSLGYVIFATPILAIAAPDPTIHDVATSYFVWVTISPLIVASCFQLDGFYIGATRSKALRDTMIISGIIYAIALKGLTPILANHGLWLAMEIFMIARAITLLLTFRGFNALIEKGIDTD
ncbi:MAG: MATE family efflux transporter [bacterium]